MTIKKTIRGIRDQIPAGYVIGRTSGKGAAQLIKIKDMVRSNQAKAASSDIQTLLNNIGTTQGDILYRNATEWVVLAPGTAGFVLGTGGAGADPAWGDNHITINGHSVALGDSVTITGSDITNVTEGFAPTCLPLHYSHGVATSATAFTLPANGGSIAIPIFVPTVCTVGSITVRIGTAASAGNTGEFRLYLDDNSSNTLNDVAGVNGSLSFGSGAQNVTVALSSPVTLAPGIYWLVVRNTNASNTYAVAGILQTGTNLPYSSAQTKTLGSSLGSTLDFVAATWAKSTTVPSASLNGRVFAQATEF